MDLAPQGRRVPNRQGEGNRLRQDILDAATRILEESGREDALSLRGIARELGIAAPSIYLHFKDKTDLVRTVLDARYAALASVMREAGSVAAEAGADAWGTLRATVGTYRSFAVDNPRRYRLMFSLEQQASMEQRRVTGYPLARVLSAWTDAIDQYLAAACPEQREDAQTLGILLWTGLHGQFVLWHTLPSPYTDDDTILRELEEALMRRLLPSG
ncbi:MULTISPECIES: TetR/AcrR family transcriptional regulator [Streptomyces]|uniref:TetR/AcrR family transcriptional regulator n=2 Tax=Streptomyces TaxID=1883 RepID=A0ABV9J897_9ACTN